MKRQYNLIICALFALYIGGFFIINMLSPQKTFSENENRYLAQRPEFSVNALINGSFTKDFETYVTDQFAYRDSWVSMKSYLEKYSGKMENNGIYIGRDGTLLKRFNSPDESRLKRNAKAVEDFANKVSVPVYCTLIPSSAEIWSDKLPKHAPSLDEAALIQSVYKHITKAIPIDSYGALEAHKNESIYYRTDHHWTTLGAYYSYAAQASAMGLVPKALSDFSSETVTDNFYGTYFSTSGVRYVKPDSIEKFQRDNSTVEIMEGSKISKGKLYDDSFLLKKDKYGYFLGGNPALVKITTANNSSKKLLIVRDSYANAQAPFWTNNFSEVYLADLRYMKLSLADYVKQNGIDMVLVQYSTANFSEDTKIIFLSR